MTKEGTAFFETSRVTARRFQPTDLTSLVAIRSHPEVMRYQSWSKFDAEDAAALLAWVAPRSPGDPGWFQFALESRIGRSLIGDCGLRIFETDNRLAQVGYTIGYDFWGSGLGTELVRGLVAYTFTQFPLHRITASVDPRNVGSVRVLEKAGFVREAQFRQSEWFKGSWVDDHVYALLRSDARVNTISE